MRSALAALPSGGAILGSVAPHAKSAQEIGQQGLAKDARTRQERVEQRLVAELTDRFAPWRVRSEAQGEIKLAPMAAKEQVLRLCNLLSSARAPRTGST